MYTLSDRPYCAQPNRQNVQTGDTPLHVACRMADSAKVVTILLKYNADPRIANNAQQSPLDVAKTQQVPDQNIIEILSKEISLKLAQFLVDSPSSTPRAGKRQSVVIGGVIPTATPLSIVNSELEMDYALSDGDGTIPSPTQMQFTISHEKAPRIGDIDTDQFTVQDIGDVLPSGDPRMLALTTEEALKLEAHKINDENPFGIYRKRTTELLNGMLAISETDDRIPDLEGLCTVLSVNVHCACC